jgi:hypothetical protein
MRAMNALGRRPLNLQNNWAACGVGITDAGAAFFISGLEPASRASPYNHYYDLRDALRSQYS